MKPQSNNEKIINLLSQEKPIHTHTFVIIKGSGKEIGIPLWECNCGEKVKSN